MLNESKRCLFIIVDVDIVPWNLKKRWKHCLLIQFMMFLVSHMLENAAVVRINLLLWALLLGWGLVWERPASRCYSLWNNFFFFVYNFWWNNPLKKIKIGGTMFPLLLGRILILINVPRLLLGLSNIVLRDFGSCFHVFLYLFFQFWIYLSWIYYLSRSECWTSWLVVPT